MKCTKHGRLLVRRGHIDKTIREALYGDKRMEWVCPDCQKEQAEFFSSIANQLEVGLILAREVVSQHDKHLIELLSVLRDWYRTPANQVSREMKENKLYPSCCGSERPIWDAVDEAIAKVGGEV